MNSQKIELSDLKNSELGNSKESIIRLFEDGKILPDSIKNGVDIIFYDREYSNLRDSLISILDGSDEFSTIDINKIFFSAAQYKYLIEKKEGAELIFSFELVGKSKKFDPSFNNYEIFHIMDTDPDKFIYGFFDNIIFERFLKIILSHPNVSFEEIWRRRGILNKFISEEYVGQYALDFSSGVLDVFNTIDTSVISVF